MADVMGFDVNIPTVDISGFLSSSWIYVAVIAFIGVILVAGISIMLFFMTYNKKVVVFENISGMGYQPVLRTKARIVKLGIGGEEVLKTLAGGHYVSAYGRKMGKNTYWYAKGQDGYWYNCTLGDLDTKLSMLDIEPVDRDVRMFHVALDKLSHQTYGKTGFLEKYGMPMLFITAIILMMVGNYIIAGKINEGIAASNAAANVNLETVKAADAALTKVDSVNRGIDSGLVDAGSGG